MLSLQTLRSLAHLQMLHRVQPLTNTLLLLMMTAMMGMMLSLQMLHSLAHHLQMMRLVQLPLQQQVAQELQS